MPSPGYTDAQESHDLKGTVIPRAIKPSPGNAGVTFDCTRVMPFNVVIDDPETGLSRTIAMTPEAIARLQKANRVTGKKGQKYVSYEDVVDEKVKPYKEFVRPLELVEEAEGVDPYLAELPPKPGKAIIHEALETTPVRQPSILRDTDEAPQEKTAKPARDEFFATELHINPNDPPKVKVKLSGAFGSLTVPYHHVFISDIYLVAIQYSSDQSFYEAPFSEDPITVNWNGNVLKCLPGPQFPLGAGSQVMISVFFIIEG